MMTLYFLLGNLTEEGQKMLNNNPNLIVDAVMSSNCDGAEIMGQYAVLSKYDFVIIAEAADNEAVAQLSLEVVD
jgi:uncharacterized protein with GYD domain